MQVLLSNIKTPPRLRAVSEKISTALADSMAREGQYQAITVAKEGKGEGYILIDGAHRLRAAKLLGWQAIRGDLLMLNEPMIAQLLEANSNLARAGDTLLSKAVLLLEGKKIYEQIYPNKHWGGDRRSTQFRAQKREGENQEGEGSPGCSRVTKGAPYLRWMSQLQGVSERTLKEYVQIAKNLGSKHCKMILQAALPVADHGSHLKCLMRESETVRLRMIELMIARPGLDFPDALRVLGENSGTEKNAAGESRETFNQKRVRTLEKAFNERLDLRGREELMRRLLAQHSAKLAKALAANGYSLVPMNSRPPSRVFEGRDAF